MRTFTHARAHTHTCLHTHKHTHGHTHASTWHMHKQIYWMVMHNRAHMNAWACARKQINADTNPKTTASCSIKSTTITASTAAMPISNRAGKPASACPQISPWHGIPYSTGVQAEDQLLHVQWYERVGLVPKEEPERDIIVFPGECSLREVRLCRSGCACMYTPLCFVCVCARACVCTCVCVIDCVCMCETVCV